jgi:hypothetical protein
MKKKSNLVPAHQIVVNISLIPPIIVDGASGRSHVSDLAQRVKRLQRLTEKHSSSAILSGGRYHPREASLRTSFAICHHRATRVGAEDVIKVEFLSQRRDVGNRSTSIFTRSQQFWLSTERPLLDWEILSRDPTLAIVLKMVFINCARRSCML